MEEADALCSRIGIMAGGSLRAIGTQLYLKSRFGDGFKVTLNCVDESMERLRRVNDFVTSLSADAKFVSRFGAHLTYTVPIGGGDGKCSRSLCVFLRKPQRSGCTVAAIFNRMESSKRELGILEWVSHATLLASRRVLVSSLWPLPKAALQAATPA